MVSLPTKWTKKFDIKAGDDVELEEQDKDIIVRTKRSFKSEKEILDFTNIDKMIKRILVSRYFKGLDEIEVKVNSLDKARIVQKRVEEMIGMEIIEQTKDRFLVKDLQGDMTDNFDTVIRRVFYLLNSLSDESLKAIQNKETDLEYLNDIEKNINRFTDYCFRILIKKGYSDYRKTSIYYCMIYLLEDLGDEYKLLVNYIHENKIKLDKNLIDIYSKINIYQKNLQKLFFKFDMQSAIALTEERDLIVNEIQNLLKDSRSVKDVIILKNFEKITNIIVDIMGQLLNIN